MRWFALMHWCAGSQALAWEPTCWKLQLYGACGWDLLLKRHGKPELPYLRSQAAAWERARLEFEAKSPTEEPRRRGGERILGSEGGAVQTDALSLYLPEGRSSSQTRWEAP